MKKHFLVFAVVALIAGSGGYYLAMMMSPAGPGSSGPAPTGMDTARAPAVQDLLGQLRPDFTLQDVTGKAVTASDFDGHIWLVNFWATWCKPCVEEMPMLSRLQQEYADQGLKVVGIALDDAQRAGEFAAGLAVSYTILVGKTDVVLTGRRYGNATGMLPFSVLMDSSGVIRWTHLGALSGDELRRQIQLLK